MRTLQCVTGRDPDGRASIPNFDTAYFNGDQIREIAEKLISAHNELRWINDGDYRIVYFWKGKGGTAKGKPVIGKAAMATGIIGHLTQATFQVVMSADHCRELSNIELEAAIYHQLCHLHEDESEDAEGDVTLTPAIRPHDLEMFRSELDRYGFWSQEIRGASSHFATQLKLEFANDKRFAGEPNPYEVPKLRDTDVPLTNEELATAIVDDVVEQFDAAIQRYEATGETEEEWTASDEERRRQRLAEREAEEAAAVERELAMGVGR